MPLPVHQGPEPLRVSGLDDWANMPITNGYQIVGGYVALYPNVKLSWMEEPFRRLAGAKSGFDTQLNLIKFTDGVPRARMLTDVMVSADPATDVQRIDLKHAALVDRSPPPLGGTAGTAQILVDRPGHLSVRTESDGRQLMSLSERFDEGWTGAIDGHQVAPIAVNGDFLGVVVEPGTHVVELLYQPKAFARGRLVSLVGVVMLIASAFIMLRR